MHFLQNETRRNFDRRPGGRMILIRRKEVVGFGF